MTELRVNTYSLLNEPNQDDYDKLIALAYTFCRFGKIHPFLDGNGHVQRAVFHRHGDGVRLSAVAALSSFIRGPSTACLPLPWKTSGGRRQTRNREELGLVAEYLAFFLEGPFNAPRKHVGIASLYSS